MPNVDVIIAVRNGMPFIRDAVTSALNQSNVSMFVYVVDDGSNDGTVDEILSMGSDVIRVITGHPRESAAAGRNRGVELSNSEWICFLDSDDLWPHNRTEDLIGALANKSFAISYGRSIEFREEDSSSEVNACFSSEGVRATCIGGTVFSRSTFERVGPLNTRLQVGEFVEWFARARVLGIEEVELPQVSLFRRNHSKNTSRERRNAYAEDYLTIVKSHLHRLSSKRVSKDFQ